MSSTQRKLSLKSLFSQKFISLVKPASNPSAENGNTEEVMILLLNYYTWPKNENFTGLFQ